MTVHATTPARSRPAPPIALSPAKRLTLHMDVHVGLRIRAARLSRQMSQTDLAEACNITFQQIQKYEKGTNRVASGRLSIIAETLGHPVEWFFADGPGSNVRSPESPIEEFLADTYGAEVARAFMSVPYEDRKLFRDAAVATAKLAVRKASSL
jgi:transcriptional regulator with XRE-family HTH domain